MCLQWLTISICVLLTVHVRADYECVCSYNIETRIYSDATQNSTILGYIYEFDCRPTTSPPHGISQKWKTIAFQHQVGYILVDAQINTQICPGNPSSSDIRCKKSKFRSVSSEDICSTFFMIWEWTIPRDGVYTQLITPTIPPPTSPTTTPIKTQQTSTTASTNTSPTTSTTATSATTTTTATITTATTTTVTTTTATSTTSKPTTPSSTTKASSTLVTSSPSIPGNVQLCPHPLHQYTIEDKGALAQFGNSCYEIVPIQTVWLKAEKDCVAKGGHLFHISNQREQDFILKFINFHQFAHACWMGLHDIIKEEQFEWTSGDNLTYTNWWHDRLGNIVSHHSEDCVLFVPYSPYFGKWDDVPCGYTDAFGVDQVKINPFICQFPIHGHYTYVPLSPASSVFGKRQSRAANPCSSASLQKGAYGQKAILSHRNHSCYELVPHNATWSYAEQYCTWKAGHLLQIADAQEEAFILNWVNHLGHLQTYWIGLNDRRQEESFTWTSGDAVTYTNWMAGRKSTSEHNNEDCVFVKTEMNGKWDDADCGSIGFLLSQTGVQHPYICEFQ